jgi:hypothetical protein
VDHIVRFSVKQEPAFGISCILEDSPVRESYVRHYPNRSVLRSLLGTVGLPWTIADPKYEDQKYLVSEEQLYGLGFSIEDFTSLLDGSNKGSMA